MWTKSYNNAKVYNITLPNRSNRSVTVRSYAINAQDRIITLFAEIDDKTFLVAQAISFQPVLIPAGDGFISLPAPKYKLALLSIESCLANREDFIPIQSLKP